MGERDVLSDYWRRPIPLQSQKGFSLLPEECGKCHKEQYNNWGVSLHSRAFGPGLLGQFSPYEDPGFTASCYFCHAPMKEQSEVVSQEAEERESVFVNNPVFNQGLKLSGVSCSVCHLREGEVHGPPAEGAVEEIIQKSPPPHPAPDTQSWGEGKGGGEHKSEVRGNGMKGHNGFIEKDFFEKSEFCASCHQMDEGYELNGKLLTNTYREWKESIYGENKISCQSCHMPERRHLFRGIHDPEMVRKGITFDVAYTGQTASLLMTNSGVGHLFPTYVTPSVVVKGYLVERDGKMIPSSVKKAYIGRRVTLDLSEEEYDTRLAPGKTFEFDYVLSSNYGSSDMVAFEVWVYPDEFYNRFYKKMVIDRVDDSRKKEIEKALKLTEGSHYMLFKQVLPLHD